MNRRILLMILTLAWLALSTQSFAQVPPRTYLKPYNGMWSVPLLFQSLNSNVNPTDSAKLLNPGVSFDADILQAGYYKAFALTKDRAASLTALLPMGRVSATGALNQDSSGYGDLLIEFNMHINNARPLYNKPDQMRYEPGLSVNLIADLIVPIGEYKNSQVVNLGQNRWIGRIGMPIVWQLGPWVPGQRTTLEVIPSGLFFTDNNDYALGDLETDPMFALGSHLTRDLDEQFWVSADINYVTAGYSKVGGVSRGSVDVFTVGGTVGVPLTSRLQLTIGYASTVDDEGTTDIRTNGFLFSLTYASATLWRGFDRLEERH